MDNMANILSKLLGKIFLRKPTFFGLDEQKITLLVSPSFKVFGIYAKPERLTSKFPFEEQRIINTKDLKNWAKDNDFDITYSASSPRMKRALMRELGDVMVESDSRNKEKELSVVVMEELDKSHLPESIKEWAKDNPQKFIENLQHVQNILKK